MALSTGCSKIRTAVFITGTGSNLKSLIKFSKTNKSPISIEFVVSSNSKARGLNYAKINDIKNSIRKELCKKYLRGYFLPNKELCSYKKAEKHPKYNTKRIKIYRK